MARVRDVRTFENFSVKVPSEIHPERYKPVIIWCEAFKQFISVVKYQ
jgi:hypothetical protein